MTNPVTILIGASAGGVSAVQKILSGLPKLFQLPIVVTQHLPADADVDLELVFGRYFSGRSVAATDKMPIEPGHAYFAPPSYHLLIERDQSLALAQDEPVNFARPSIDVLFESAAWALGPRACGILLTGANSDGAQGLLQIKKAGGMTIVHDPREAEAPYMPKAALELFKPDFVMNLDEISRHLSALDAQTEGGSDQRSAPR